MAVNIIAHTIKNNATTDAVNTSGANKIFVCVGVHSANLGSVTDSKGNSWTRDVTSSSTDTVELWRTDNPTVGSGHTFSYSGSGYSLLPVAVTGLALSAVDQSSVNSTASATSLNTGSITPTLNNEWVVSLICVGNLDVSAIDSGFTLLDHTAGNTGVWVGIAFAYKQQTTAAAVNPSWTITGTDNAGAMVASYKSNPALERRSLSALGTRIGSRQVQ